MDWFYISLISPALWAVVGLFDDNLLQKVYRSAVFGAVISGLMALVPLLSLFFIKIDVPEPGIMMMAIGAGVSFVFAYLFYFKALESEFPSVTMALFNLASVFLPVLAFIFLDEVLKGTQYIGLSLIIVASFLLTILDVRKFKFSRSLYLMALASVCTATSALLEKYVYRNIDFWSGFIFCSIGMGLGAVLLMVFTKKGRDFIGEFSSRIKKWLWVFLISELINVAAVLLSHLAISKGPVSAVKVIEGILPLYMLVFAIALHYFFPDYFREGKHKGRLKKLILMSIMVVGLYFVYA